MTYCMLAFVVFVFSFSVLSPEICWEERLRNDLFCVEWDATPQLNQSYPVYMAVIVVKIIIFKVKTD